LGPTTVGAPDGEVASPRIELTGRDSARGLRAPGVREGGA
jgi:hypothetical protein